MSGHTPGPYQRDGRFIFKLVDNPEPKRGRPEQVNLWMASVQPCGIAVETAELEAVANVMAAAPDLLEALEAVEWCIVIAGNKACPRCKKLMAGWKHSPVCFLGNAIKKARGEG